MQDQDTYGRMLQNYEQIEDADELARALHESGLAPNGDARVEALFRRAMRGNGYYSQLLGAIYGELA